MFGFCAPLSSLMAQPQLSPDMAQPAMNQFLAAAFGVQTNPFSVKDIFESREDAVAWGLLERTLKLDDKQAHDLYSNIQGVCVCFRALQLLNPRARGMCV